MNQKDYKVIAKINKECYSNCWFKNYAVYERFCNQQADYFEKEDKKVKLVYVGSGKTEIEKRFNRKQFLGWCGVKKNEI